MLVKYCDKYTEMHGQQNVICSVLKRFKKNRVYVKRTRMNTTRMLDTKTVVHKFDTVQMFFNESYAINGSLKVLVFSYLLTSYTEKLHSNLSP